MNHKVNLDSKVDLDIFLQMHPNVDPKINEI